MAADAMIPISGNDDHGAKDPSNAQKAGGFGLQTKASNGLEMGDRRDADRHGTCIGHLRIADIMLRSAVVAFMVVSLSAMFTSTQRSAVHIFGFNIGVSMRWNRSQPFEFLVVVNLLICAYALAQFVFQSVVFVKKASPTRRRMWMQLVADQACAYLVLAAAAAAAGASRTNKSAFRNLGVQNIHVSGVCTVLDKFCNRATIAFVFTLMAAVAAATSAALDVYLLTYLAC
ncbi:hypothetical protein GOP47_0018788 [Adiantum capillus-veneris]|uniref:CASP-like protein n=1 Tax=Adiantum capillus-veneris TaxID=13818 RepID=A0A9D4UF49_ADICA|nr:hypothetical protein GOP47_0018788 [Adiantum capillus-veneris]